MKSVINNSLIKEIAERLKNPEEVLAKMNNDPIPEKHNRPRPWHPLSLSHGYPGILYLFASLDELSPNESWDQVAHGYVLKIKETIEMSGVTNLSLFGGLTGCCLAIQQASKGKTRYRKLLESLNNFLFQKVQDTYFSPLQEKIELKIPVSPNLYDPISGICGIGIYALKNQDCPLSIEYLQKALFFCISLTKDIKIGNHLLPGWYVPRHYQFTDSDKDFYPLGNFNLGIAHGVAGILAFLSISVLSGICINGQMEAIQKIVDWICSKKKEKKGAVSWPYRISFEEELSGTIQDFSESTMEAWCYGTAGLSRVLYLAGKALKSKDLKELSVEAFEGIFQRVDLTHHFSTPSFCHGLAGFLTLTRLMARDTESIEIKKWIHKIEDAILEFYDPNHPFGFKDFEPLQLENSSLNPGFEVASSEIIPFDKLGLLEGVSGILLSLFPIFPKNNSWTAPFLIEGI